jgi:hypothetical protein
MNSIDDFKAKLEQEIEAYLKATGKQCQSLDEINYHMQMFAETLCKKKQALGLTHVAIVETSLQHLMRIDCTILVSNGNYHVAIVHHSNSYMLFGKEFMNFIPKGFVPLYIQFI